MTVHRSYRGLRCRPIEVEYFFEVIRGQVTSFQMIEGASLIFKFMKYVVFIDLVSGLTSDLFGG